MHKKTSMETIWNSLIAIAALALVAVATTALAQDTGVDPAAAETVASPGFPAWVLTVLAVIGGLRLILKPIMSFISVIVKATPTAKDDALVETIEASAIYKGITYVLDWISSIKIGPQLK
jgi:hypothetical protein